MIEDKGQKSPFFCLCYNIFIIRMLERHINPFERRNYLYSSTIDLHKTSNTASVRMKPYSLITLQKYDPSKSVWYSNNRYKKEVERKMTQSSIFQRPYLENPFNKPSLTYNKQMQEAMNSYYYSSIRSSEPDLESYRHRSYKKRQYDSYQYGDEPYEKIRSEQPDPYSKPREEIKSRKPILKQHSFEKKKETNDDHLKKNHYAESEKDDYDFNYEIENPMVHNSSAKQYNHEKEMNQQVQNQRYVFEENEQSFRRPDSPKFAENQVFPQYLEDRGRKFYFIALKHQDY